MRMWLEEVADVSGPGWDCDRYALAARHLGQFNGSYLLGRPLPDYPFLGDGWLRSWVEGPATRMVETVRDVTRWEHPLLRRLLPRSTYSRVFRLWEERGWLLRMLEDLPLTFCHRDAFRSNLLARFGPDGQAETVAIDWAFAGIGPIGEEIAPLIAMRPVGGAEEFEPWDLEAAVFDGYVQGLEEAGWPGGLPVVRFGYTASSALRYVFPTVMGLLRDAQDKGRYAAVEERRGRPIEQIVERQAALISFLLERADEARRLMPSLNQATTAARG
jgi:hypothetical protein